MGTIGPVELIVAAFDDENEAEGVVKDLRRMDREGVIQLLNAAVLVKKANGKLKMRETQDVGGGRGAIFGAVTGALIGLIGGPPGAVVGAVAGAATGGVAASQIDMGFSDKMLKKLQESLTPGSSAVLALVQHEWVDRVIAELEELDAALFRQSLKEEVTAQLAAQKGREKIPVKKKQEDDEI
jgi:uncharacterized membrane protein